MKSTRGQIPPRRQEDDRDLARDLGLPELCGRQEAVEGWQIDIEQDDVGSDRDRAVDPFSSVEDLLDQIPLALESVPQGRRERQIVLHQQDPPASAGWLRRQNGDRRAPTRRQRHDNRTLELRHSRQQSPAQAGNQPRGHQVQLGRRARAVGLHENDGLTIATDRERDRDRQPPLPDHQLARPKRLPDLWILSQIHRQPLCQGVEGRDLDSRRFLQEDAAPSVAQERHELAGRREQQVDPRACLSALEDVLDALAPDQRFGGQDPEGARFPALRL
jgi:hypothetical protein